MKRLSIMFLAVLFIFSSFNSVFAAEETEGPTENIDYSLDEINWSEIDKIIVLYTEGPELDPFIKEAQNQGVEIAFETSPDLTLSEDFAYFKTISWISRDGVLSLSVNPKNPNTVSIEPSWQELVHFFQNDPLYINISNPSKFDSTYNQYKCHAHYARGIKTPWNLEPSKPDKGYWGFVGSMCN